jgi:hypothetical protein
LLSRLTLVAALAVVVGSPSGATEGAELIALTVKAATYCTLSAGKNGVDKTRFDDDPEWQPGGSQGGYYHPDLAVTVGFPADDDGVARICEVPATLSSQDDLTQLRSALEALLKQKPIEQSGSVIWMFGTGGNARGLQFFSDTQSDQPRIRFIGAAF